MTKYRVGFSLLSFAFLMVGQSNLASAQTSLKFALDYVMWGANSAFVLADERGYYRQAELNVHFDPSTGSAESINRVASGAYDLGFADSSAVMEFASKNPEIAPKIVLFIHDKAPSAIFALKEKGIKTPKDLMGHSLGYGATHPGTRLFPLFARLNGIDIKRVDQKVVDGRLRDSLFVQKKFDSIIAFEDSILQIESLGLPQSDVNVMTFFEYGLPLYGNVMIASRRLIQENPAAVRGATDAAAKGWRDAIRDPAASIDALLKRNNLVKRDVNLNVLGFMLKHIVATPYTQANGIGAVDPGRLSGHLKLIAEAFNLSRIPAASEVYDDRFFPPLVSRKFAN